MPLVRIDLDDAIPAHRRRAIADAIHDALVTSLAMPPHARSRSSPLVTDRTS